MTKQPTAVNVQVSLTKEQVLDLLSQGILSLCLILTCEAGQVETIATTSTPDQSKHGGNASSSDTDWSKKALSKGQVWNYLFKEIRGRSMTFQAMYELIDSKGQYPEKALQKNIDQYVSKGKLHIEGELYSLPCKEEKKKEEKAGVVSLPNKKSKKSKSKTVSSKSLSVGGEGVECKKRVSEWFKGDTDLQEIFSGSGKLAKAMGKKGHLSWVTSQELEEFKASLVAFEAGELEGEKEQVYNEIITEAVQASLAPEEVQNVTTVGKLAKVEGVTWKEIVEVLVATGWDKPEKSAWLKGLTQSQVEAVKAGLRGK